MATATGLRSLLQNAKSKFESALTNGLFPRTLLWILLLALFQGIIYALIIPAWWHNDEMGHFEYAWLAANQPAWPKAGDYNQDMRRQMALSALDVRWYQVRGVKPNLKGSAPIPIGVPQTGREPLYAFLASLPLRLLHNTDIILQYYAARSVSFILYLLILVVVWFALGEILPPDHPLRWMVPAFLALLPGFIDAMTAVNSDVAGVLAASLFLWAGLRLIQRGYSLRRLLFLALSLLLCYLAKDTARFTFVLTPLVLILALLRGRYTWVLVGLCLLSAVILPMAAIQWGAPLGWYQTPDQPSGLRSPSANSRLGSYEFQISYPVSNTSGQLLQFVTPTLSSYISDHTLTLGGWFWADSPAQISPYMTFSTNHNGTLDYLPDRSPQTSLELNTQPAFYRFIFQAPANTQYANIIIPYTLSSSNSRIFIDGLVLTPGEYGDTPPHFTDSNATQGTWDGQPFQNVIRDGSAEQDNLRFRPWALHILRKVPVSLFDPAFILSTFLDRHGTGWYYRETFSGLFRTFWTSLAADRTDRSSTPSTSRYALMLLTFLGVAGALLTLWRRRKTLRWDVLFFLGISILLAGTIVVLRGLTGFVVTIPILGWARYIDPVILPIALVLCAGWLEWLNLLKARGILTDAALMAVFMGGLIGISALAMVDAMQEIHSDWWREWQPLVLLLVLQIVSIQAILLFGKARRNP